MHTTRKQAREAGNTHYATGRPCKNGHVATRQTTNGNCTVCNRDYALRNYAAHPARWKARTKAYQSGNRLKVKKWAKTAYLRDVPAACARARRRQAAALLRTPPWLSAEHHADILALYVGKDCAQALTGEKLHVDHIVPLQGETVSGLHVPWNLQIVTAAYNLSKSNKLLPEHS